MDDDVTARSSAKRVRAGRRLVCACGFALASAPALASYGQFRLDGLIAGLLGALMALHLLLVDLALLARFFRSRGRVLLAVVPAILIGTALVFAAQDVGALLHGFDSGWQETAVLAALLLAPPLAAALPLAQWRAPHSPVVRGALLVQLVAVVAAGWAAYSADHASAARQAEWQALRARGAAFRPGEGAALLALIEDRYDWGSIESLSLMKGLEDSPPVRGDAPLGTADRAAVVAMLKRDADARRFVGDYFGVLRAKLLWDTLAPGQLPERLRAQNRLDLATLGGYLERYGARLCVGGRFAESDRRALLEAFNRGRGTGPTAGELAAVAALERRCAAPP